MRQNIVTQLQRDWLEACEQVGIPAITTDTSARIMAVIYVHGGGEEEMVLNQKFVKDPSKTISQLVVEATAQIGEKIDIRRFVRYEMGEGLQKKSENLADEVAAQMNMGKK